MLSTTMMRLAVCYCHVTHEFQNESTVYSLPECKGTPCSKQAPYLKFKWQQRDSNPQPLSSWKQCKPYLSNNHAVGDSRIVFIENEKMILDN